MPVFTTVSPMPLARLAAITCALVLAASVLFLAACGSAGSSSREGQGGSGAPASEEATQQQNQPPDAQKAK
jgi:ABC-type oligopeptide transport system substrate-binding subunit